MKKTISVEVAYVEKNKEVLISIALPESTSVLEALQASRILIENPEISDSLEALDGRLGIFGKLVALNTILKAGDRIEIYRPLHEDPKVARRKRGTSETKQNKQAQRLAKALRRANKRSFRERNQDK